MRTKKKTLKALKPVRVKKAIRKPTVKVEKVEAAPAPIVETPLPEPVFINHARLRLQQEAMNKKAA